MVDLTMGTGPGTKTHRLGDGTGPGTAAAADNAVAGEVWSGSDSLTEAEDTDWVWRQRSRLKLRREQ
jgi:hypothetical protein